MAQIKETQQDYIKQDVMERLDVQQYIDENKMSVLQWFVFIAGVLIIFADGLDAGVIGFVAPSLLQEWGVSKAQLAPALSAALVGMSIGALVSGVLADKFGRRWVINISTAWFGVFTLLSAFSTGLNDLTVYRFLTGLGLGAAMPNIATLVAEYMPKRNRAKMVNFVICAFPLGITVGGLLASKVIPVSGWSPMFIYCGIFPIVLTVVLIAMLPESIPYLLNRAKQDAAKKLMLKITGNPAINQSELFIDSSVQQEKSGLSLILSPSYRLGTMMLWLCCFMSLLVFYLLTSWLPIMLNQAGFNTQQYSTLAAIFPFGGVFGAIIIGFLMDSFRPVSTIKITYFIAVILFVLTSFFTNNIYLLGFFIFLCGSTIAGAQSSLPTLTALNYPVQGRASGVSWMHGIGRIGAICGALFGSQLLAFNWGLGKLILILALPVLIAAIALVIKSRTTHSMLTVTDSTLSN